MKYIITASYEGTVSTVETNDIEMLFNAVLMAPERIAAMFAGK